MQCRTTQLAKDPRPHCVHSQSRNSKKDEEEHLSKEDLRKMVNSEESKMITKEMLKLEQKTVTAVSRDQFAKYCDNLIEHMLCKAAQRPDALATPHKPAFTRHHGVKKLCFVETRQTIAWPRFTTKRSNRY